jgi:hypothetical protein
MRLAAVVLIACCAVSESAPPERRIATGWTLLSTADYRASIDQKVAHGGSASLLLASVSGDARAGAVRQIVGARAYLGKRIRLSGWLKTNGAEPAAALWLRIDMNNGDYVLDGMLARSPSRDAAANANGWARYDIVAAVPADAMGISFGVRAEGRGELWADDFSLSEVNAKTPTTTIERRRLPDAGKQQAIALLRRQYAGAPARPVNLGFEMR